MILPSVYSKIPGQTLFLGASVLSFNSSVGWGGGSSTLQVELIEDFQPTIYANDPHYSSTYSNLTTPNHYYLCGSDTDCYVDETGQPYNDNKPPFPDGMRNDPKEKNVPGKIYYKWENNRFVSKYWIYGDPGFFATGTTIPSAGTVPDVGHNTPLNNTTKYVYDIINTPVYFKFGDFEFIGLVKSWERNNKPGGITYSVTIESFDSILESSYVILDSYGGSIFGIPRAMDPTTSKGSPINLVDSSLFNYEGLLSQGNIPNIFNVYGFLESFGINFFGGSNLNSNGLRAVDVLRAISILTSAYQLRENDKAFSPFGRILTKTIADISPPRNEGGTPTQNTIHNIQLLGIIPQNIGTDRYPTNISTTQRIYNTFSLDLSDISNIIPDFRISGSQSIADIIRIVCEASGKDFITKVIPAYATIEGSSDTALSQFVIKVISIDKTSYQPPDRIKNIIQNLETQKYLITNSSFGQESNENYTYNFLIGGPQQRLLQVKNYRLSFNQTNYVYNPILKTFINLNKPWNKARVPDVFSTRNNIISQYIFGETNSSRINAQDNLRYNRFNCAGIDDAWSDNEVSVQVNNKAVRGNYRVSTITNVSNNTYGSYGDYFLQTGSKYPCDIFAAMGNLGANQYIDSGCEQDFPNSPCPVKTYGAAPCVQSTNPAEETFENLENYSSGSSSDLGPIGSTRFFNLQNDFICPYFGRALEDQMPVNDDTNEFRRVRPVFLDTWTNQITVAFSIRELPSLSIGEPLSLYDNPIFSNGYSNTASNTSGLQRNSFNQSQSNPRSNISQASRSSPPDLSFNPVLNNIRRSVLNRPGFTIKETEMRAAMTGFDSYLAYCLGKSHFSKPDLFLMLATAYAAKGQLFIDPSKYNGNINTRDDESGLTRKHTIPNESSIIKYNVTTWPQDPLNSKLKNNWNILLNHNFLKDLTILHSFIKDIADTYYGKQYLVKVPDLTIYSDQQYESLSIRSRYSNISVYGGSKRLFYSYEIAKEGAWEEPGNFIDDCMVVGDNFSTVFTGDNGLIQPIVGYNNSVNIDDVRKYWCELDAIKQTQLLFNNLNNAVNLETVNSIRQVESGYGTETEMDPRDKNHQQNRINNIRSQETVLKQQVLNHVRQFGSTFNCIPGLTERLLNQSWNSVWQSSSDGLNTGNFDKSLNCLGTGGSFSTLWSRMIQNNFDDAMGFITNVSNKFTSPSLDISSLQEDFVIVPVDDKKEPFSDRPVRASKVFARCDPDKIIFMNISSFTDPRVVVKTPGLTVADSSASYSKDPGLTVIANIAIEDLLIYIKLHPNGNMLLDELNSTTVYNKEVEYLRLLKRYIVPELAPDFLVTTGSSSNPSSAEHDFCAPRAAHPHFFAIPLKSNQFCYGPWVNFPDLIISNNNIINNNMIHKIKVEQNNDLVPWNYGNASLLDSAAYAMIGGDAHYQTILENGSISMIGMPVFGIGGSFSSFVRDNRRNFEFVYDNSYYSLIFTRQKLVDIKLNAQAGSVANTIHYNIMQLQHNVVGLDGPIISNMTLQVGNDSIVTNYRFQTYNPRTGLYNKEYTDALKEQATENNKFKKAIANLNNSISTKITREINQIFDRAKENRTPTDVSKIHTRLFGNSPTELIVGQGRELLKNPDWYNGPPIAQINDRGDRPLNTRVGSESEQEAQQKFLNNKMHHHWAGIVIGDESLSELKQDFDCKSAMSLDGLLSPISLYPTRDNATYHISTYLTGSGVSLGSFNGGRCPLCGNTKAYPMQFLPYKQGSPPQAATSISIPCPVCNKAKLEVTFSDKDPDSNSGFPDINYKTLCPVLISEGEFRNPYASGIDRCRDSINVVSAGKLPPTSRDQWAPSNRNKYNQDKRNADYSQYDSSSSDELLNKRFFALRGPLMMHGWGYDTAGYPVPNALDMPYRIDGYGRPLRFQLIQDVNNKKFALNDLEKPGLYEGASGQPGQPATMLGDIITKRYQWQGTPTAANDGGVTTGTGKWVKKSRPSKKFYLNWAERPDMWPVGPIDLRWDASRRVWDASGGCKEEILPPFIVTNKNDISTLQEFLDSKTENKCPYRNVYITLENDMIKEDDYDTTYSTRGFIDDVEYNKDPLQNGYRRLVYVIDKTGYTAPKGTKLLCRYDRLSGFYEPLSKPSITAIGVIGSSNSANIRAHYIQGRRSGVVPSFVVNFDNPLDLSLRAGNKGIFIFINGKWTLSSAKV